MSHRAEYENLMKEYTGRAAIGHVRYATCGADDRSYAQPFERHHIKKHKWFSFAFNGQLANYAELRENLLGDNDNHLARETDTEIFMHEICTALSVERRPPLVEVFRQLAGKFDGAYSMVFLDALGDMVVARDPLGIKPLCYALEGPLFAAASESVALLNLGFAPESIKSLPPGQAVVISDGRLEFQPLCPQSRGGPTASSSGSISPTWPARWTGGACTWPARPWARNWPGWKPSQSTTRHRGRAGSRHQQGGRRRHGLRPEDSQRRGLIRNRYSGRTFIEGSGDRKRKAETKYTPLREVLEGKRVLLVEDSIVRATTAEGPFAADARVGAAQGNPCPRGLPAHHFPLLLRHRHVDGERVVRPAVSSGRAAHSRGRGPYGRPAGGRFAPLPARRSHRAGDRIRPRRPLPGLHYGQLSYALRAETCPHRRRTRSQQHRRADLRKRGQRPAVVPQASALRPVPSGWVFIALSFSSQPKRPNNGLSCCCWVAASTSSVFCWTFWIFLL